MHFCIPIKSCMSIDETASLNSGSGSEFFWAQTCIITILIQYGFESPLHKGGLKSQHAAINVVSGGVIGWHNSPKSINLS